MQQNFFRLPNRPVQDRTATLSHRRRPFSWPSVQDLRTFAWLCSSYTSELTP